MSEFKSTKFFDKMIKDSIKESGETVSNLLTHIKHLYHSRVNSCLVFEAKLVKQDEIIEKLVEEVDWCINNMDTDNSTYRYLQKCRAIETLKEIEKLRGMCGFPCEKQALRNILTVIKDHNA
jgi:hypothetical protein